MTIEPILLSAAGGSIAGFFVGYAIKKVMRWVAIVIGAFLAGLIFLQYKGLANVNTEQLKIQTEQSAIWVSNALQYLTSQTQGYDYSAIVGMTGFSAFFAIGFMKG